MANNCCFTMRITGKRDNANKLLQCLKWEGDFQENGIGRCFSADPIDQFEVIEDDFGFLDVYGDCAWSVSSAMLTGLERETKNLQLIVEVFSEETGCQFQEHIVVQHGTTVKHEVVDYEEHWIECCASIQEYNEEFGTSFTEDMIDCNGCVCIGGFDNFEDFEMFDKEDFK